MSLRFRSTLAPLLAGLFILTGCSDDDSPAQTGPDRTIPEVAADLGGFETLLGLVASAGLDGALAEEGPFTVFAPTNEAFEALPPELVAEVTSNLQVLQAVLLNHVVEGEFNRMQVMGAGELESLLGETLEGTADGPTLFINGVEMVATNVFASNGVIHAVAEVLLPSEFRDDDEDDENGDDEG